MHARGLVLALVTWLVLPLPQGGAVMADLAVPGPVPVDGTPAEVRVELEDLPEPARGPVELKLWLGGEGWQASRTWNGTAFERSDRYVLEIDAEDGSWSGWVPVRANPTSRNHDRLTREDVLVGLRVRGPDGVEGTSTPVAVFAEPEHRLLGATPGMAVEVLEAGAPTARRSHRGPTAGVLEIAVPAGFEGQICPQDGCPSSEGLVLDRVGASRARIVNTGEAPVLLDTGVVVLEEARCVLSGTLGPGERLLVDAGLGDSDPQSRSRAQAPASAAPAEPCAGQAERGRWRAGRLWHAGRVVDQAPDPPGWGEVVREPWGKRAWAPWRLPVGVEPAPVRWQTVEGAITGFATEQAGLSRVLELIHGARERLSVATYMFTNERVADALVAAQRRGVDVSLLLEPTPVGGLPSSEQAIVRRLEASGVEVRWQGGALHKHGLQHAKVLVADGAVVLVLTENLTHSGLPSDGEGNLGLGVGVANATLARRLEAVLGFEGASTPWQPTGWQPFQGRIAILTSPENAWRLDGVPAWLATQGRVDALVLRVSPDWGPRPNAWLEALAEASTQRPVRVLASGLPDGARRANHLGLSALTGDPAAGDVTVRLSGPSVGTVHAKAMIGGSSVFVGSSNWGLGGVLLNREVGLIVEDRALALELGHVFDGAWNGTARADRLPAAGPAWTVQAAAVALAAGLVVTMRWR